MQFTSLRNLLALAAVVALNGVGQTVPAVISVIQPQTKTLVDCSSGITVTIPAKPQDAAKLVFGKNVSVPQDTSTGLTPELEKMISDGTDLWAIAKVPSMIVRLERVSRRIVESIAVPVSAITSFALDGRDIVWIGLADGSVLKYSRLNRQVTQKLPFYAQPGGSAVQDMAFMGQYLVVLRSFPETIAVSDANLPPADPFNPTVTAIRSWSNCDSKVCRN